MNSRIRQSGLSAIELWTQRDQITGEQLAIDDRKRIMDKQSSRVRNHPHSSKSKAHGHMQTDSMKLNVGDLVHLKSEGNKTRARDKYTVVSVSGEKCTVRKFIKNQFRAKSYDVLQCDCYPVTPTVSDRPCHELLRGLQRTTMHSNSSSEDDLVVPAPPDPQPVQDEQDLPHLDRPPDVPVYIAEPFDNHQDDVPAPPNPQAVQEEQELLQGNRPPHVPLDIAEPLDPHQEDVHMKNRSDSDAVEP